MNRWVMAVRGNSTAMRSIGCVNRDSVSRAIRHLKCVSDTIGVGVVDAINETELWTPGNRLLSVQAHIVGRYWRG